MGHCFALSQPPLPTNHWYNVLFQDRTAFEAQLGMTEIIRRAKAIFHPCCHCLLFSTYHDRLAIFRVDMLLAGLLDIIISSPPPFVITP
jgi:hypothetical protein